MNIVIVGGGFAGRSAARALRYLYKRKKGTRTILFDKYPYTTMKPSLPMVISGEFGVEIVTGDIKSLIPEFVEFRQEQVLGIDLFKKTIKTQIDNYSYDYIVLACGSITNLHGFDHSLESLYKLDTLDDAVRLECAFMDYIRKTDHPVLVVSGGGYTGLEIGGELYRLSRRLAKKLRVVIVEHGNNILSQAETAVHEKINKYVHEMAFEIVTNSMVTSFDGSNIQLKSGESYNDIFFCWCAGTKIAIDDIKGDFETIADKRIIVNEFLQLPHHPEAFAPADTGAQRYKGAYLRKAVNFALDSGCCAGVNVSRLALDMPLRASRPIDLGQILPIYNSSAGRALGVFVSGKTGLRLHYFMCGYRNYSFLNMFMHFVRAMFPAS
jgi:NADH dehydrogenase